MQIETASQNFVIKISEDFYYLNLNWMLVTIAKNLYRDESVPR